MGVPTLSQISVYPVKSIAGITLPQSVAEAAGLQFDRRFVLSDNHGRFITARTESRLALIQARLTEEGMLLHAPGMPQILVRYKDLSDHYQNVTVWQDEISAQYCAPAYDQWFSEYLGRPCQLLYFGALSQRQAFGTKHPVSFADGYPLLLISQGSLDALNQRLETPMLMSRFRPSLVVANTAAFAEDSWQQIRIGSAEFRVYSPCARCVMTTLAPGSAEPHPLREPLATLQSFRSNDDGEIMFGQNLLVLKPGLITQGDKVEVLSTCTAPLYVDKRSNTQTSIPERQTEDPGFTLLCTGIREDTHDVKTFEFCHYDGGSVAYLAGQHIAIELVIDGEVVRRRYTLSSSPEQPQRVTITVKRKPEGRASNYLHDRFDVGYIVHVRKVEGHFHLPVSAGSGEPLLFISAGSGVTPLLSMLRTLASRETSARQTSPNLVFLHSARTAGDIIAREEVAQLANRHGNCDVLYTLTRETQVPPGMYSGKIDRAMLEAIPRLTSRQVYLCGPTAFKTHCEQLLSELGLPSVQFHFESFGGAAHIDAGSLGDEMALQIHFSDGSVPVTGSNQDTILNLCERAGRVLPSDCRAGICGECKVTLLKGEVTRLPDMGGLTQAEQDAGYILTCSCIAQSDITLGQD